MKIVVIDYGLGNVSSIINMIKKIGIDAIYSHRQEEIVTADKLILPGVGAFDYGMKNLFDSGLIAILNEQVILKQKPILGICLGMQLFMEGSEEGDLPGLGWIKGKCKKFKFENENNHLKVPHMGWNVVRPCAQNPLISDDHTIESRFYFVHSYHALCANQSNVIATTTYGYEFPAMIQMNNILGAQFHPEKSHKFGMKLLKNFIEIT